ncbi:MAG: hypothetical protein LBV71_20050 [Prevotella sp.]|jgi:hypothetical protein|nr:hypothetical protein [Prevotella sp.]
MKDKNLKKETEFKPGKFDPEQVVGDQNSVSGKVVETEKPVSENTENESEARRTSRILNDAEKTREKLNSKLNDVRDYGADARETTL